MTKLLLKQQLRVMLADAVRIAVIGIGSELRADDAVGLLVLKHLQKKALFVPKTLSHFIKCDQSAARSVEESPPAGLVLKLFYGGTAPENLTGEIKRFKPDCLTMIDAVEMGKKPGACALIDLEKVTSGSFLTHKMPIKLMLHYLSADMNLKTVFIGVQPKILDFDMPVSKAVVRAARSLAGLLMQALNASGRDPLFSGGKRISCRRRRRRLPARPSK